MGQYKDYEPMGTAHSKEPREERRSCVAYVLLFLYLLTITGLFFVLIVSLSLMPDLFDVDSTKRHCTDALLYTKAGSVLCAAFVLALGLQCAIDFYFRVSSKAAYSAAPKLIRTLLLVTAVLTYAVWLGFTVWYSFSGADPWDRATDGPTVKRCKAEIDALVKTMTLGEASGDLWSCVVLITMFLVMWPVLYCCFTFCGMWLYTFDTQPKEGGPEPSKQGVAPAKNADPEQPAQDPEQPAQDPEPEEKPQKKDV